MRIDEAKEIIKELEQDVERLGNLTDEYAYENSDLKVKIKKLEKKNKILNNEIRNLRTKHIIPLIKDNEQLKQQLKERKGG